LHGSGSKIFWTDDRNMPLSSEGAIPQFWDLLELFVMKAHLGAVRYSVGRWVPLLGIRWQCTFVWVCYCGVKRHTV